MSVFGSGILERLNDNSGLVNPDSPAYKLIDRTVGEWLDDYDEKDFMEMGYLQSASGKWLDLHGKQFNVLRKINEDDETYRKRIIYETLNQLTVNYLVDVYNISLYIFVKNFAPATNKLTSDNPFLNKGEGYMAIAPTEVRNVLNKKFVLGSSLKWLIL